MKPINKEDKAGLYITVILHVTVVIILLISQLSSAVKGETSFLLDFSKIEETERKTQEQEFKDRISERLDKMIGNPAHRLNNTEIRNIAVDASSALKDDRNTDAEKLYEDAERLAKELKNGFEQDNDSDNYAEIASVKKEEKKSDKTEYKGPSVAAYILEGRKAKRLSIPAYRCMGGGYVTVIITVNKAGEVVNAKVDENQSEKDGCLRNYAVRAARLSKFSASESAPDRQMGEITYLFISQ